MKGEFAGLRLIYSRISPFVTRTESDAIDVTWGEIGGAAEQRQKGQKNLFLLFFTPVFLIFDEALRAHARPARYQHFELPAAASYSNPARTGRMGRPDG